MALRKKRSVNYAITFKTPDAMKPLNPFLIEGYYSPEYFCDRTKETEQVKQALLNGRNLTIIAPRRMGKSGLIKNVFFQLRQEKPEIKTYYVDIFSTQNLNGFIQKLAATILGTLESGPQKALTRVSQILKSCRPVISFDAESGIPNFSVEVTPQNEEATLKEIFEYLVSSQQHCIVAIDEFQQIAEYPEKGVEALLRSYIQFMPNVQFIFSGSRMHLMSEMFVNAKRPFYQSTQLLSLGTIDEHDYYRFAAPFFHQRQRPLPEAVFHQLYSTVRGHTWYVQDILNRLYSYWQPVDEALLEHTIDELIIESSEAFSMILEAYSPGCVRLLKAIAKEGCVSEINSADFLSRYGLRATSSVNTSLRTLLDNEHVYRSAQGYIIYNHFFSLWLKRYR